MGEIQFNHDEALDAAYAALHALRQEGGDAPSIKNLAKRSGVSRSTINTKHPDWVCFRNVVKKKLPIIRLTQAGAAVEERAAWIARLESLEKRLGSVRSELQSTKNLVDEVFQKITGQLHKYVLRSKETPQQTKTRAEGLKKNAYLKQELDRVTSERDELRHAASLPADIRALARKEVVTIDDGLTAVNFREYDFHSRAVDTANSLDDFFAESHGAVVPSVVYLLCGNIASGKSKWINDHLPLVPGVNLYLDGINHTVLIRRILIKRIRKLAPSCTVSCVRLFTSLDVCIKRNSNSYRERTEKVMPEEFIMSLYKSFEEVSIEEDFDQIILIKNK